MGGLCTACSDLGYDPVAESPAAYVCMMRERALNQMVANNEVSDSEEEDEAYFQSLSKAEQRAYYDKKVKKRLAKMSAGDQQAMFKRFNVSVSDNPRFRQIQLMICINTTLQNVRKGMPSPMFPPLFPPR